MLTVIQGEDGERRAQRARREQEAMDAELRRRDAATVQSEAERVAHAQIANRNLRRPIDYAAILKYRAIEPGFFVNLPSDEECHAALQMGGPGNMPLDQMGGNRSTLKLKK